jgi:hypothetical protein
VPVAVGTKASGPVLLKNDTEMINLNFNHGLKLNDLNVDALSNHETIVRWIQWSNEAFIQSLSAPFINGFDVTDLENRY